MNSIHKRLSAARGELAPWNDKMASIEAARQLAEIELGLIRGRSGQAAQRLADVQARLPPAPRALC